MSREIVMEKKKQLEEDMEKVIKEYGGEERENKCNSMIKAFEKETGELIQRVEVNVTEEGFKIGDVKVSMNVPGKVEVTLVSEE